jgi:hypothetical protein
MAGWSVHTAVPNLGDLISHSRFNPNNSHPRILLQLELLCRI